jgi:hypothetical protein
MHASRFGEREKSALGTARRRWQNRQAANVNRTTTWQSEVGKALADWIVAIGVGLLGPGKHDYEEERVERNDGWRREPFV